MTAIRNKAALILATLVLLGLAGCKEKPKAPVAQAPKAQAPAAQAPQPDETKVEKEVYIYDTRGRRDPFMSLIVDIKKEKPQRKKANPVENFDVDEIKLIAIAWENSHYYAMIALPDGKAYTVRKGMTLGLYGGKVEEITQKTVRISEQVKDYRGRPVTKDTILKLRQEGE